MLNLLVTHLLALIFFQIQTFKNIENHHWDLDSVVGYVLTIACGFTVQRLAVKHGTKAVDITIPNC